MRASNQEPNDPRLTAREFLRTSKGAANASLTSQYFNLPLEAKKLVDKLDEMSDSELSRWMAENPGAASDATFGRKQPKPTTSEESKVVLKMVASDLADRAQVGLAEYGTYLETHNGRDALRDAYEEALDLVMYLRQALSERDDK